MLCLHCTDEIWISRLSWVSKSLKRDQVILAKLLNVCTRMKGVSSGADSQGLLLSQCCGSWLSGFKLGAEAVASGRIVCIFWSVVVTLVLQLLHHLEDGLLFISIHLAVLLEMRPGLCIPTTVGHLPLTVFHKACISASRCGGAALAPYPFVSDVAF